jgi:hypothetical protein
VGETLHEAKTQHESKSKGEKQRQPQAIKTQHHRTRRSALGQSLVTRGASGRKIKTNQAANRLPNPTQGGMGVQSTNEVTECCGVPDHLGHRATRPTRPAREAVHPTTKVTGCTRPTRSQGEMNQRSCCPSQPNGRGEQREKLVATREHESFPINHTTNQPNKQATA